MSSRLLSYKRRTAAVLSLLLLVALLQGMVQVNSLLAASISVPGAVTGDNVYVRAKAGRTADKVLYEEEELKLSRKKAVTVKGQKTVDGEVWYKLSFKIDGTSVSGYMLSDYVALTLKKSVPAKMGNKVAQPVYKKAGKNTYLKVNKKKVTLAKGKAIKILGESTVNKKKWFQISFTYGKKTYKGYVLAGNVMLTGKSTSVKVTPSPVVTPSPSAIPSDEITDVLGKKGVVTAHTLNVRKGAGTKYAILSTMTSPKVQLGYGTEVMIVDAQKNGETLWYEITFAYNGEILDGYVSAAYIQIGGKPVPSPSAKPVVSTSPKPSDKPVVSKAPVSPLTDKEFEAALDNEEFPESYKDGLRELHRRYPLWSFKAFHTNCDWNTAIAAESAVGKNLITNSKASGWKSYANKAYNWATDKFVPYDGSTWVTASKAAVEYYMDPRNFLTTDGIFQFEYLNYIPEYQDVAGVESILRNTVLGNQQYTFTNEAGEEQAITYGETFIDAAEYSLVNPFHLATRVKQEVVTSKGLSGAATGTYPGHEGYYNFYNIGATHSTVKNGALINGLNYAKYGNGMSAANKQLFKIPWNSPYNAILGGAKYIGNNYINRGQNTVYLQKFNVTSKSQYNHQYMANVEAAKAEAQKTYAAYQNFTEIPVVFYIPVYLNMPSIKAPVPSPVKNPNNWLKTLSVTGCTMTPTFNINNGTNTTYTVIVDSSTTSVKINATSVSSLASIKGTGTFQLEEGNNTFTIKVTAENGDIRTYIVYVIRQ